MENFIKSNLVRVTSDSHIIRHNGYLFTIMKMDSKFILSDFDKGCFLIINKPNQLNRLKSFGQKINQL